MTGDRMLDLLALAVLAWVAAVGVARTVALAARGIWVLPIDRERSVAEGLVDLAFLLGLLFWLFQAVATAAAPGWRVGTGPFAGLVLPQALRWLGLVLAVAGVALHLRALLEMGASWRFTIDRERAGELVTHGVFAWTRNPVYLALVLVGLGVSLALGSALLVLLACAAPFYLVYLVRREERFLMAHYGEAYERYCRRVPRWLPWPRAGAR